MRRFDKLDNIIRANLLTEQRYLEEKGMVDELSPELKYKAYQQADTERGKYSNSMGGEENQLKANRRDQQTASFSEIHPSIQNEAKAIGPYVFPGAEGSVKKQFYHDVPTAFLTFKHPESDKFCGYSITKNEIAKMPQTNTYPQDNIARRIERLCYKIQKTELPDLSANNEL